MSLKFFSLISVLVLLSCVGFEPLDRDDAKYIKVIECTGDIDYLYNRAFEWAVKTLGSVEISDTDTHKIIGKGRVDVTFTFKPIPVLYSLTIDAKQDRLRVTFENLAIISTNTFSLSGSSGLNIGSVSENTSPFVNQLQLDAFMEEADFLISSLTDYLSSSNSNDW